MGEAELRGNDTSVSCDGDNIYIANIPKDPHPGKGYRYYRITPTTYEICASFEGRSSNLACGGMDPGWCLTAGMFCNYKVTNP
jgi:hypothetical protein